MNTITMPDSRLLSALDQAFSKIDAVIPVLDPTLGALGKTDEAKVFALAMWAIQDAHQALSEAMGVRS